MSRILILGANGLLGQAMQKCFAAGHEVFASSLEPQSFVPKFSKEYFQTDLTNRSEVRNLIIASNPEIIINTAAYTNVDGCENNREQCWAVNVLAVENILEAPYLEKPIFVQISTDYVFDGEMGAYREIDKPNPRGNYARSKMAAENIVSATDFEYLLVRTQVLYGTGQQLRPNFVTWLVDSLRSGKKVRIVNDQIGSPTYSPDVAEAVKRLLASKNYGLFHVSSPDRLSRHAFALRVAEIFGLDASLIEEVSSSELQQDAPRPMRSDFVLDKLYNHIRWQPHRVDEALKLMKKEMEL